MVDVYWCGRVKKISAEAPIPVIELDEDSPVRLGGGASNVLLNLAAMGCRPTILYDVQGSNVPYKNRLMVGDHQIARWDQNDYCEEVDPRVLDVMIQASGPKAIVVSDYNKGAIGERLLNALRKVDIPLYVDTKRNPSIYRREATFFPNLEEYERYKTFYSSVEHLVLKKGEGGITIYRDGQQEQTFPAYARFGRSVNGAGDVVMAAYVAATLQNMPNPGYYAAVAAAIAVENPLTTVVEHDTIVEFSKILAEERNRNETNGDSEEVGP